MEGKSELASVRRVPTPNYSQRARRSSPGPAPHPSTGRLIDRFRDQVVFPITYRAQLMESLDNQGRDVAAITRNLVPQHR